MSLMPPMTGNGTHLPAAALMMPKIIKINGTKWTSPKNEMMEPKPGMMVKTTSVIM